MRKTSGESDSRNGSLSAAGLGGREGGEVGRKLVGREGLDVEPEQAEGGDAEIDCAPGAIDDDGDPGNLSASVAGNGDGFLDTAALGDDVFDDQDFFARGKLEAATEDQAAFLLLHENEADAELAGDFLTDDESSHRRGDHRGDPKVADLKGEGGAKTFDGRHVLKGEGALEELPTAEAAPEDEMAFEEGAGTAKDVEDISGRHGRRVKQPGTGGDKAEDAGGVGLPGGRR